MPELTEDMFDNESVDTSSSDMQLAAPTMNGYTTDPETQEPTIIIVLMVEKPISGYERLEIKLRRNSSFGKLASLLRTKFDYAAKHVLQTGDLDEWKIVFDTDTPASLKLEDRAQLRFVRSDIEPLDASKIL
ncbi:hypothetical protein D6D22_09472 [Aureobasidium pullulans]|uniref:Rad60/SUMO-like domain-containing protein n=1 Tax=Aureobasidium pullulans TaxID=5580 RepID=A0A4S8X106_AURPU|nr:hypothetical protein D6D22_09472 [Aureobasidium pullulans]